MRRLIAAVAIVVVIILLLFLVKGCVDSRQKQSLKDYNRDVGTLLEQSQSAVSTPLFEALQGASTRPATEVQETINQLRVVADEQLKQTDRLDAPGDMSEAQSHLALAFSLRRDGVQKIADLIQTAVGNSAGAGAAVNQIAGQMQAFNASDVIYSQRVGPLLLHGLKSNGIAASYDGTAGERVAQYSDFLPNIGWMSPTNVAQQLGTSSGATTRDDDTATPGLHGHQLDSVSVGGTTLSPDGSNELPASPPPTFAVTFTNGGDNDETDVQVTVEIAGDGQPLIARAVVPNTTAKEQTTANVAFKDPPPTGGPVTIKVTIGKVAGEETLDNNEQTYNALFS